MFGVLCVYNFVIEFVNSISGFLLLVSYGLVQLSPSLTITQIPKTSKCWVHGLFAISQLASIFFISSSWWVPQSPRHEVLGPTPFSRIATWGWSLRYCVSPLQPPRPEVLGPTTFSHIVTWQLSLHCVFMSGLCNHRDPSAKFCLCFLALHSFVISISIGLAEQNLHRIN